MTKIHDIESLKRELKEKEAELKKIQSNIDKYYSEQILSKDIIKKFKIEKISKFNFISNYAPSITTDEDSFLKKTIFIILVKTLFFFLQKKKFQIKNIIMKLFVMIPIYLIMIMIIIVMMRTRLY